MESNETNQLWGSGGIQRWTKQYELINKTSTSPTYNYLLNNQNFLWRNQINKTSYVLQQLAMHATFVHFTLNTAYMCFTSRTHTAS